MAGIKQMSDQMGISKGRAKNLMNTAKQMNKGGNAEIMGYADGGMARIQGRRHSVYSSVFVVLL